MVVSNIGNGYDALTGVFTAPYSGTYLFVLNIMVNNNNYIQVAIDKSGTLLGMCMIISFFFSRFWNNQLFLIVKIYSFGNLKLV